jgi:hypothetical protein
MSDDLEITRATPDGDLQSLWAAIVLDLRAGRRGVTDPRVYEVLFQRKIRRLEGMPASEAEAIARDETLKSLHTVARQQVDLVAREHQPTPTAPGPAPPPDDVDDEDQLSPGEVMQLMSDRREGKASPDEVRRLLSTFCKFGAIRAEVIEYLRESCAAFLNDDYPSWDKALGLERGRGRPPRVDKDRQVGMAIEVLRLRLAGKSFEVATEETGEAFSCKVTTVSEAWAAYWPDAIDVLFAERMLFGCGDASGKLLTPEEAKRFERIERSLVNTPAYSRHFAGVTTRTAA